MLISAATSQTGMKGCAAVTVALRAAAKPPPDERENAKQGQPAKNDSHATHTWHRLLWNG